MRNDGTRMLATNLHVVTGDLRINALRLPIAQHQDCSHRPANAYSASLLTQYVHYAREEGGQLATPRYRLTARAALSAAAAVLRIAQAERVVQWNSWLFSTNPLPATLQQIVPEVTGSLLAQFPQDALLVRCIDELALPGCAAALTRSGYLLIASRRVYHFDGRSADYWRQSTTRRERKLLQPLQGYTLCEHEQFVPADVPRIAELYRRVYIQKHSRLNADYLDAFFARALQERWLTFFGLRGPDGRIDAAMGCLHRDGNVSTPVLGYDTQLPEQLALYRRLVMLLLSRVAERREQLNFSSGAGEFKRRRGGRASIEYNALYVAHLSRSRRAAWQAFAAASQRVAASAFAIAGA